MQLSLSEREIQVLEMIEGTRSMQWGAAVSICLETLEGHGLIGDQLPYDLTEEGRQWLRNHRSQPS